LVRAGQLAQGWDGSPAITAPSSRDSRTPAQTGTQHNAQGKPQAFPIKRKTQKTGQYPEVRQPGSWVGDWKMEKRQKNLLCQARFNLLTQEKHELWNQPEKQPHWITAG